MLSVIFCILFPSQFTKTVMHRHETNKKLILVVLRAQELRDDQPFPVPGAVFHFDKHSLKMPGINVIRNCKTKCCFNCSGTWRFRLTTIYCILF